MTTPGTVGSPRSADLERSLDRAVLVTRCGRMVAACGVWLAAAAAIVVALAAIDAASAGRLGIAFLPPAARIAVVLTLAAVPAAASFRQRTIREGWPRRLSVALATERRHPRLGESLSRAVEFLEDVPAAESRAGWTRDERAAAGSTATTDGLRQLAVDQAAAAAADVGRLTVPGIGGDAGWAAAGIVAVVAVWISTALVPGEWSDAVRRQVETARRSEPVPGTPSLPIAAARDPDVPLPPAAALAAIRLARAASVERQLAHLLPTLFAQAPGVPATAVSRTTRRQLDDLAAVQSECLRTVDAIRPILRTAAESAGANAERHREQMQQAVARLDAIDHMAAETIAANISANRLSLAGDAAESLADVLSAAAAHLGVVPDALTSSAGADPGPARGLAAAAAVLDRIAARHAPDRPDASTTAETAASATGSRPAAGRGSPGSQPDNAGGSDGAANEPAGGRVAAVGRTSAPGEDGASPIERVWSRLPAVERSQAVREAVESLPPAYRAAVDAYYRALLQSTPDRHSVRTQTAPPLPPR